MAKTRFTAPKGMRDIMPDDLAVFRHVESVFRDTCQLFAFREIRTPHLESTDLFCRTVGETTDIVEKEMYALTTKGGDKLALRPENTAGVVRAYLEHGLHRTAPLQKLYYFGEQFRHESAQKKRYREFTQAGVEVLGAASAQADAEVIALAVEFFRKLGLGDVRVELNSFGCPECRDHFRGQLLDHFLPHKAELCPDCKRRLDRNVFRLLDCKEDTCRTLAQSAPVLVAVQKGGCECADHFMWVTTHLKLLKIKFVENHRLVRGLDYYTRTVFEIFPAGGEGRQDALGAGGRYDGLAELLGGPHVPAIGFALGVDRIALELTEQRAQAGSAREVDVCIVAGQGNLIPNLQKLAMELRRPAESGQVGLSVLTDVSLENEGAEKKNPMRWASKQGARVVVVLSGDQPTPALQVKAEIKDMIAGQPPVALEDSIGTSGSAEDKAKASSYHARIATEVRAMLRHQRKEAGK